METSNTFFLTMILHLQTYLKIQQLCRQDQISAQSCVRLTRLYKNKLINKA